MARHLRLPADLAALVDDAHGRLFDGDIQTGIVPHAAFLLLMFVAAPKRRPRLPSARSAAPHLDGVDGPRPDGIALCQGGAVNRTTRVEEPSPCRLAPSVWISRRTSSRFTASTAKAGRCCAARFAAISCCSYSVVCILALSASRRARRRTIGPANSAPSGTRCG